MGAQGFNSYFQIAEEGTQLGTESIVWGRESNQYNTGLYMDDESMASANEQKFLTELGRTGTQDRGVKRHRILGVKCEGSVSGVVYPEGGGDKAGIGLLLKHLFGDIASGTFSGEGTHLHAYVPHDNLFGNLGAASGTSLSFGTGHVFGLTFNIGREDDPATIRNYPYLGCRIRSMTFSCSPGEELKYTVEAVGRVAKAHATAKTPAFPTMAPFMFKDGTFQIGVDEAGAGGTSRVLDSWSITIANNFTEVWTHGTNVLGRVVPSGQRVVTGSFSAPYSSWIRTEHGLWKAGTASSLNMSYAVGPYTLEFRCPNIYYTGNAPSLSGMEEQIIEMPFQALVGTNFDVKVFLTNTDTTVGFALG